MTMMTVTVLRRFWDIKERCVRRAGDVFTTTDARAREIFEKLPNHVAIGTPVTAQVEEAVDAGPATETATAGDAVAEETPIEEVPTEEATEETPAEEDAIDYSEMTVQELRALCAERGIDAPKRAKKATLIGLLEG